jgi:hypothetical protein
MTAFISATYGSFSPKSDSKVMMDTVKLSQPSTYPIKLNSLAILCFSSKLKRIDGFGSRKKTDYAARADQRSRPHHESYDETDD